MLPPERDPDTNVVPLRRPARGVPRGHHVPPPPPPRQVPKSGWLMLNSSQYVALLEQVERLQSLVLEHEQRIRTLEAQAEKTNTRILLLIRRIAEIETQPPRSTSL